MLGDDLTLTGFVNDWIFLEELQAVNVIDHTPRGGTWIDEYVIYVNEKITVSSDR
jgi:hypothetical protein